MKKPNKYRKRGSENAKRNDKYKSSDRYLIFCERLDELKNNYVIDIIEKDPSDFSSQEKDFCRGHRVLCHAEIESYIEDRLLEVIDLGQKLWSEKQRVNLVLLNLFAHYKFLEQKLPTDQKVNQICKDYERAVIERNNGIKEEDLKEVLNPIGFDTSDFDAALIATLDSYGSSRGTTAHKSGKKQNPIDIKSELRTIDIIKDGLKEYDIKINELLFQVLL